MIGDNPWTVALPLSEGLVGVLRDAMSHMSVVSVDTCSQTDRLVYAADIARAVSGEVRAAYAEQCSPLLRKHGKAPNYRLALEDLLFAERWVAWLQYRADLALWHDVPENRAAATAEAGCTTQDQIACLPDDAKARLADRPVKPPRECTLKDAPPGWPPTLQAWSWSQTFDYLLHSRRVQAGAKLLREPGDDDEDAVGHG